MLPGRTAAIPSSRLGGRNDFEIQIASVSEHTLRLSILPVKSDQADSVPFNGSLVRTAWGPAAAKLRANAPAHTIKLRSLTLQFSPDPLNFTIANPSGETVQTLTWNQETGVVGFASGNSPLLGLGEGGPQFDRRGSTDRMKSGQGGYKLATHGGRVPIPWIIGTGGLGDVLPSAIRHIRLYRSAEQIPAVKPGRALPLDIFLRRSRDPATIMAEYAGLTGHPEMPPLWSFGYQQSHRTLASREEVLAEAKTFREKKLPCDALIYLGTGFCPSGWNTENGSFVWNSRVFPDPKGNSRSTSQGPFPSRGVHAVILSDKLRGTVRDACELPRFDEEVASCHWDAHRKDFAMGVDGWWPDEGDPLDIASRLVRNRMYWEGPQIDRPNERPYALHRNGYAGMQRYASFLWSGDVYSTWETLKVQIPIAINTGLTGIPYWGTDIGGFVPTKEFTAELYVRWFQFGAFCPALPSHGRAWKLRLPWGWNTGDPGPIEINNYNGAAIPDSSQLHNEQVEAICRKYLELRYRMLPYLYSAVHECATTGMPIMRALWLHYPDDPKAVACGDQYLWGKNVLGGTGRRKRARPRARSISQRAAGTISGRTNALKADAKSAATSTWRPCRSMFAPDRFCRSGPVKQFTGRKKWISRSPFAIYPGADALFLALRRRRHLPSTTARASGWESKWIGMTPGAA